MIGLKIYNLFSKISANKCIKTITSSCSSPLAICISLPTPRKVLIFSKILWILVRVPLWVLCPSEINLRFLNKNPFIPKIIIKVEIIMVRIMKQIEGFINCRINNMYKLKFHKTMLPRDQINVFVVWVP